MTIESRGCDCMGSSPPIRHSGRLVRTGSLGHLDADDRLLQRDLRALKVGLGAATPQALQGAVAGLPGSLAIDRLRALRDLRQDADPIREDLDEAPGNRQVAPQVPPAVH